MTEFTKPHQTDQTAEWERLEKRYQRLTRPDEFDPWYYGNEGTDRGISEIAETHCLSSDDLLDKLDGKHVLDVGAGISLVEDEAAMYGIKTTVIPLNLPASYFTLNDDKEYVSRPKRKVGDPNRAVVAAGHTLPFADESFDIVIATYSLPFYASTSGEITNFLDEGVRVLRPEGEMLISPGISISSDNNRHETKSMVEARYIEKLIQLRDSPMTDVTLINKLHEAIMIRRRATKAE